MIQIQTDRLVLRENKLEDLELFKFLSLDKNVTIHMDFIKANDEKESKELLERFINQNEMQDRTSYSFTIIRKNDNVKIGWIGIGKSSEEKRNYGEMDFGYAILPEYWNKGYMTEALKGMIDYVFENLEVNRISGECDADNPASVRVMEKVGMSLEEVYEEENKEGKVSKTMVFTLSR